MPNLPISGKALAKRSEIPSAIPHPSIFPIPGATVPTRKGNVAAGVMRVVRPVRGTDCSRSPCGRDIGLAGRNLKLVFNFICLKIQHYHFGDAACGLLQKARCIPEVNVTPTGPFIAAGKQRARSPLLTYKAGNPLSQFEKKSKPG